MTEVDFVEIVPRILSAAVCGGILGWERESHKKPAGLRTNMLVAIGAATATLAALDLFAEITGNGERSMPADPVRIVSGVIGGLGFLGAGAIIQSRGEVQGMTTAATIWVVGGIGVACGIGNFQLAFSAVGITFLVLFGLGKLEIRHLSSVGAETEKEDADA